MESIPYPLRQAFGPGRTRPPPTDAEIVGDRDQSAEINTKLNGRHFGNEATGADRRQNDETKPIRGPEAE